MTTRGPSLRLDFGVGRDLLPFLRFGSLEFSQLIGSARIGLDASRKQLFGYVLVAKRLAERRIKPVDNRLRCLCRRIGREPGGELIAFQGGFIDRRQVGSERRALEA